MFGGGQGTEACLAQIEALDRALYNFEIQAGSEAWWALSKAERQAKIAACFTTDFPPLFSLAKLGGDQ
jgi:hypothetical protein